MFTFLGPTRSFICGAVPELPELRLTAYALPKATHAFGPRLRAADRLIPASPNSLVPRGCVIEVLPVAGGASASWTVPVVLTLASAKPRADRFLASPQHGGESASTS